MSSPGFQHDDGRTILPLRPIYQLRLTGRRRDPHESEPMLPVVTHAAIHAELSRLPLRLCPPQVFFGSLTGQLVVMDVHGAMVSNVTLLEGVPVLEMSWNCEKFKMEERDETTSSPGKRKRSWRVDVDAIGEVVSGYLFA